MKKIAIIGSGPRGMSVLERSVSRLIEAPQPTNTQIYLIDNYSLGNGRVWRETQSNSFLMNTIAYEISAFSGIGSYHDAKPGAGPSFYQWWLEEHDDYDVYQGFAPRKYYGEYLKFVFEKVKQHLPKHAELIELNDEVVDIRESNNNTQQLKLKSGEIIEVDSLVIATGHSTNQLTGQQAQLSQAAAQSHTLSYIEGDSAADMPLDRVPPNENVGLIGMGLSFYDIMSYLTEGRGGKFSENSDGSLTYHASGLEPHIICGSRSGMPVLGRGKNQKPADYSYNTRIFTAQKAEELRQGDTKIDFVTQVWPLIEAEVNLVYFETYIKNELDANNANQFITHVLMSDNQTKHGIAYLASDYLKQNLKPLDLYRLARPFKDKHFHSQKDFENNICHLLQEDIIEANLGNLDSPLKAALDVLRNTRDKLRLMIDYGGLSPETHQLFVSEYAPIISFLCAGPPRFRIKQLLALMEANVLTMVGPAMRISIHNDQYLIRSEKVDGAEFSMSTLIDSRLPTQNLALDKSELIRTLVNRGTFTHFINKENDADYLTGGLNVTDSPFHPIDASGRAIKNIHVLGIPTEHTRWFMQSGSSRPSHWIDFMIDADEISKSLLKREATSVASAEEKSMEVAG